mmetsp:Transcript_15006/g.22345  ORF Transcript_15006/g.22345 Transcript_15006/m.22345 type:complete len:80 (-) Transcript_15006:549-788(-)
MVFCSTTLPVSATILLSAKPTTPIDEGMSQRKTWMLGVADGMELGMVEELGCDDGMELDMSDGMELGMSDGMELGCDVA